MGECSSGHIVFVGGIWTRFSNFWCRWSVEFEVGKLKTGNHRVIWSYTGTSTIYEMTRQTQLGNLVWILDIFELRSSLDPRSRSQFNEKRRERFDGESRLRVPKAPRYTRYHFRPRLTIVSPRVIPLVLNKYDLAHYFYSTKKRGLLLK